MILPLAHRPRPGTLAALGIMRAPWASARLSPLCLNTVSGPCSPLLARAAGLERLERRGPCPFGPPSPPTHCWPAPILCPAPRLRPRVRLWRVTRAGQGHGCRREFRSSCWTTDNVIEYVSMCALAGRMMVAGVGWCLQKARHGQMSLLDAVVETEFDSATTAQRVQLSAPDGLPDWRPASRAPH